MELYLYNCEECGCTGYVGDEPGNYFVPANCPDCGALCTALPQDLTVDDMSKLLYFLQVNFSEAVEE